MATTVTITLKDLVELRGRIECHQLLGDDWVVVGALVSKRIAIAEARQERLRAKANQQNNQQEAEGDYSTPADVDSDSQSKPAEQSPESNLPATFPSVAASAETGATCGGEPKRKGHGRNGADAFTNAKDIPHRLDDGIIGSLCDGCRAAPVSPYREKVIIHVRGQSIFGADRHGFEQGRCRRCGLKVTAKGTEEALEGIGTSYITYDWSACAMLIVMHYFACEPFKRLEALHRGWGVPMPDSNQWRIVDESDDLLSPLYKALEAHGTKKATGLIIDDTGSMIVEVSRAISKEIETLTALGESTRDVRTGINATCVHLETDQGKVVLFFTGRHHAGEILDRILAHRKVGSDKIIAVTDAASKNFDHDQTDKLEQAVCNAHCYLKFLAVKDQFPAEYAVAAEVYEKVFDNDDAAKAKGLSPEDRMLYHRAHSLPQMKILYDMCKEKADGRLVEPNSSLWEPIAFVINQWPRLTKFCEVPGVPLDSNLVEQALIIPVRYLVACFAYKTQEGAEVGDRHMSLIATANANGIEPVAYLTYCLRNHEDLAKRPEYYLPWAYRERLQQTRAPPTQITAKGNGAEVLHPLRPGTRRPDTSTRSPEGGDAPGATARTSRGGVVAEPPLRDSSPQFGE